MTHRPTDPREPASIGRRLTLTPIGLDVVAALAHDPDGLRLTPLSQAIGSPVSSVQAALRILMANRLVTRDAAVPPQYALADHPAAGALVELALVLPEAAHAMGVTLRASRAVAFAAVDRDGFIAGLEERGMAGTHERLTRSLASVAAARSDAPPVQLLTIDELTRLSTVSLGLRARLASAVVLKGRLDPAGARVRARDRSTSMRTEVR